MFIMGGFRGGGDSPNLPCSVPQSSQTESKFIFVGVRFFWLKMPGIFSCFPGLHRSWTIAAGHCGLRNQSTGPVGGGKRWSGW